MLIAIWTIAFVGIISKLFFVNIHRGISAGLYGLWGGLKAWRGQPFRYTLIGRFLPA